MPWTNVIASPGRQDSAKEVASSEGIFGEEDVAWQRMFYKGVLRANLQPGLQGRIFTIYIHLFILVMLRYRIVILVYGIVDGTQHFKSYFPGGFRAALCRLPSCEIASDIPSAGTCIVSLKSTQRAVIFLAR